MAVLEISARQFREKQGSIFEMADTGRQIVIKRGRKQSYKLTPIDVEEDDDDFAVTPELMETVERSRQQMREGKYTECRTVEELNTYLQSL